MGFNNSEVSAEENQLIENLKVKHPDWTIIPLNTDEIKDDLPISTFDGRGEASPVTELYIDQVSSQLGTIDEYYEDIGILQRTSHEVKGIVGIGVLEVGSPPRLHR